MAKQTSHTLFLPMKHVFYIFCLLTVMFLNTALGQDVYTDNVVIVLDGSGSMQGNMYDMQVSKMQAAKTAISEVLKTIPQSTHIGLIAFGGSTDKWIYPLGPRDDATFFSSLDGIYAKGRTPLGEYMKLGADALLKVRKKQYGYGSYRLLVVTDGEATDGELVERYTPDIISRGIIVDVIGVNMQKDHTLATRANSYRRANDPASLRTAIQEVFGEIERKTTFTDSDDSVFRELGNIPDKLIMSIIHTLHDSGNSPIGSQNFVHVPQQTSTQKPTPHKNNKSLEWVIILIFSAVVFVLIYMVTKR